MRWMVLSVLLMMGLSGCMGRTAHWGHPEKPMDQWQADQKKCQRAAQKELGLDFSMTADQGLSQYDESMRLYELNKRETQMVAGCMTRMGYRALK